MVGKMNKPIKRKSTEHKEQVKFIQFVRTFHPELMCFAIPNGADVSASQRVRLVQEGMLMGVPDVMLIGKDLPILAIEFKRPDGKGKVSDEQKAVHFQMESVGTVVKVATTTEEAKGMLQQWLQGTYNESQLT
jgi:hypothetical protein